jgi:hypothetical protein
MKTYIKISFETVNENSICFVQYTNIKNENLSIQFIILMQFQFSIHAKTTFFQSESLYIYPLGRSVCS